MSDLSYKNRLAGAKNKRILMIGKNLKVIISDLLVNGKIKNVYLTEQPITITRVIVAKDLGVAKVFVSSLLANDDGQAMKKIINQLNLEKGNIKKLLRYKLTSKKMPDLIFMQDDLTKAQHVEYLIDELKINYN